MDENKPSYYAIIPARVRYDNRLNAGQKLMYGEITALSSVNGYCFANNKYFSKLYDCSKNTVSRWINALNEYGYITIEIGKDEQTKKYTRKIYLVDIPKALTKNGDVIVCHGYVKTNKYVLGNIMDMTIHELIASDATKIWVDMAPILNDECLSCEAIYVCGGGCSMQSEALFGGITNIDKAFCIHSKKSLNWLLKKLYEVSIEQIRKKGEQPLC